MERLTVSTERLIIESRTTEEMAAVRDRERDPEMKKAYSEMVAGMLGDPENSFWHCDWRISLVGGETAGGLGFKGGPDASGSVEIGYGIDEPYRLHGYASEATLALSRWAFGQPGVKRVLAQTEPDNAASQRVLAKCGFTPAGQGEEGPLFQLLPVK